MKDSLIRPDPGELFMGQQDDGLLQFYGTVKDNDAAAVEGAVVVVFACFAGGIERLLGATFTGKQGEYLICIQKPADYHGLLGFKVRAGKAYILPEGVDSPGILSEYPDGEWLAEQEEMSELVAFAAQDETLADEQPAGLLTVKDTGEDETEDEIEQGRDMDTQKEVIIDEFTLIDDQPMDDLPIDVQLVDGQPIDEQPVDDQSVDDQQIDEQQIDGQLIDDQPTGMLVEKDTGDSVTEDDSVESDEIISDIEGAMEESIIPQEETGLTVSLNEVDFDLIPVVVVPAVQTGAATIINMESATLHGTINNTIGEYCDQRKFRIRIKGSESWTDAGIETGSFEPGSFFYTVTGLIPGTTYEFKAMAHNLAGWGEGSIITFTTAESPAEPVKVKTAEVAGRRKFKKDKPPKTPYDKYRSTYWHWLDSNKRDSNKNPRR